MQIDGVYFDLKYRPRIFQAGYNILIFKSVDIFLRTPKKFKKEHIYKENKK